MRALIAKREVLERVPYSYPTIWEKMRRGEFPRSVALDDAGTKVAWYADEIDEWIESRKRVELKPLAKAEANTANTRKIAPSSRPSSKSEPSGAAAANQNTVPP